MDDPKALEAVSNILNQLSEKPLDVALHLRHIKLAKALDDLESQLSAFQMMADFVAVGDEVWLPLIEAKEKAVDLDTEEGVNELLELYERAEGDYLSIPLLQRHLKFIIDNHARYTTGEELKPDTLGEAFSTPWALQHIQHVVGKGIPHLTQSHLLFDAERDWLLETLETASPEHRPALVEILEDLLSLRLKQQHSNSDETFQVYSSFTTKFKSPAEYEGLMVAASKARGTFVQAFQRREQYESSLAQTNNSLDSFAYYIAFERRGKTPDLLSTRGIYERAITEAASRRFKGEQGAEQALGSFWAGYLDAMRIQNVGIDAEHELYKRALRSTPGSGEVWARYIRFLERAAQTAALDDLESIEDAYNRAISSGLIQSDVENIIAITLAFGSAQLRKIREDPTDQDVVATVIATLESALQSVHKVNKAGDPKLRLEKFLASVYHETELHNEAIKLWQNTAKKHKGSYAVWLAYAETLVKYELENDARAVYEEAHNKRMDWPEAVWEAWINFEQVHGTVDSINACLDKVEKAQNQLNMFRAREMEKAYQAQASQYPADTSATAQAAQTAAPTQQPETQAVETSTSTAMDVDEPSNASESTKKRRQDEEAQEEGSKRARFEAPPATLKRDRENTTVFVADLPSDVTEAELKNLFKDCGKTREVKITKLPSAVVALVEFFERDSVPAALTKDKKRVQDQEISVHLAWKSTLYVTNFPESSDDDSIRELFGKYGTLFDVRWPSKKFKATRRFCYVQFTSPDAAQKALELHGHELEPGMALNVYISNPERKKERTDHDANEREVYVAGLSRYTNKADLEKVFSTYGRVKDVRIALDQGGHARGYAFIEYEEPQEAQRALDANNYELKKRRIAVTLADPRVRARHNASETGLGRTAEMRSRSVRVRNVPSGTQEGVLQQAFEKIAPVRRVQLFADKNEAVVELESAADAGKLMLRTEPVIFNGVELNFSEEGQEGAGGRPAAPPPKAGGLFVPRRAAASRPRAGLGQARAPPRPAAASSSASTPATAGASTSGGGNKGQDDFRKMLLGKK